MSNPETIGRWQQIKYEMSPENRCGKGAAFNISFRDSFWMYIEIVRLRNCIRELYYDPEGITDVLSLHETLDPDRSIKQ